MALKRSCDGRPALRPRNFIAKIPRGVEQSSNSSGKTPFSQNSGAKSGARCQFIARDADLQRVMVAWGSLPGAIRKAILSLAEMQSV
jgi:hypothetical protein